MKKTKPLTALVCILLFALLLSACGGMEKKIVGSWSGADQITFYSDGTFALDGESGKWTIVNDNVLKLTLSGSVETFTIIDLSDATLILENENGKNSELHKD